jgi:hypothetical protein
LISGARRWLGSGPEIRLLLIILPAFKKLGLIPDFFFLDWRNKIQRKLYAFLLFLSR